MSIFIPYNVEKVISYFSNLYSLDLSSLTEYEKLIINLLSNLYFYIFWFIIVYFTIKLFNRIWEKIF